MADRQDGNPSTSVSTSAATARFKYVISVTHDGGTPGNLQVNGTITVDNFNDFAVLGVDIIDAVNDGNADCVASSGPVRPVRSC